MDRIIGAVEDYFGITKAEIARNIRKNYLRNDIVRDALHAIFYLSRQAHISPVMVEITLGIPAYIVRFHNVRVDGRFAGSDIFSKHIDDIKAMIEERERSDII